MGGGRGARERDREQRCMICSLVERCGMAIVTRRRVEAFVGIPFIGHIAHVLRMSNRPRVCVRWVFVLGVVGREDAHASFF